MRDVDVLVVGAGLAGMAAASEAASAGAEVVVISAGPSSSYRAQGGIAAAIGPGDSVQLHARDTLEAGGGACDPRVVEVVTAAAPAAVEWLLRMGVRFDQDPNGQPELGLEGGHSRRRVLHTGGDRSGRRIMAAVTRSVVSQVVEARMTDFLVASDGVAGAQLQWRGRRHLVRARATVLATGGYAGLYPRSTNCELADGSGIVAAHRAGARVADLDLVQFHPTVYAGPGRPFLVTEALRGAGAFIFDRDGRRFLFEHDPRGELAPRDTVSQAIAEHLRQTGEQSVLLDVRSLGDGTLRRKFPGFLARCRQAGIDPSTEPVPVSPAAHYTMGGLAADLSGHTSLPYLWAAGECASTGLHGRNRLASNSLLEAVVVGRAAGRSAARAASLRRVPRYLRTPGGSERSATRLASLKTIRTSLASAGVLRERAEMRRAAEYLEAARGSSQRSESARHLALLVLNAALR